MDLQGIFQKFQLAAHIPAQSRQVQKSGVEQGLRLPAKLHMIHTANKPVKALIHGGKALGIFSSLFCPVTFFDIFRQNLLLPALSFAILMIG